jgi:beta-glucosidase
VKTPETGHPFLWGVATSSHQVEGNNEHNDWWQWEAQGNIETGERSGRACDHWNRFKEDLRLAKDLGANCYRFSIEWSRIEPEEGRWVPEALEWYEELVAECERLDLVPMATLHHFTIPRWLADRGGFLWEKAHGRFAGYTHKVAEKLARRVPFWCTLNEPNSLVIGQYLGSFMPPARFAPKAVAECSRNLLRAHVKAADVLRKLGETREGKWPHLPLKIGIAHNVIRFLPRHTWNPVERWLAQKFHRWYNLAWPDALTGRHQHFGAFGLIPQPRQVWEARSKPSIDFLGINYYMKIYVCLGPQKGPADFIKTRLPLGIVFALPEDRVSDLGWAVHPQGLEELLVEMSGYGLPLYVTENGCADAKDRIRGEYLKGHVRAVARARERGAPVEGYIHWSLMDNFEWVKGFEPRFGLVEIDYPTQRRTVRPSGQAFRDLVIESRKNPNGYPLA